MKDDNEKAKNDEFLCNSVSSCTTVIKIFNLFGTVYGIEFIFLVHLRDYFIII